MRTQVMQELAAATPWLEHDSAAGAPEKTPLASFPFTIGRSSSADLHIDSSQVSREHAVITRHGRKYRVRDQGSTNGTFLNGEQIEEATLNDGDRLAIANVEFTFCCGEGGAETRTATEVMPPSRMPSTSAPQDPVSETILALRRTHEAVAQRSLRTLFQPVVQLADNQIFGYEAFARSGRGDQAESRCDQLAVPMDCHANDRMRRLFRRLAVEAAGGLPHAPRLLLAVAASEIGEPSLVAHLAQLRDYLGAKGQIVVEIPKSMVRDTADFRALLASLREARIEVAYDGYASGKAQIIERKNVSPDFLKLAPSVFRSIHRGEDRQRQVQMIVRASQDIGCTVIATGIDNDGDLKICRELGCTVAQGELFGRPQSTSALIRTTASATPARQPLSERY